MNEVHRLWDTLFADPNQSDQQGGRFSFLGYVCAALTISERDEIISNNDFAFSMECLQKVGGSFHNADILITFAIDICLKFMKY